MSLRVSLFPTVLALMQLLRRTALADLSVVDFFVRIVIIPSWACASHLRHNRLFDTFYLLSLFQFVFIFFTKLDVGTVVSASQCVAETAGVLARCPIGPRSRAVVVVFGVAGPDDLADQVGHIHLDV